MLTCQEFQIQNIQNISMRVHYTPGLDVKKPLVIGEHGLLGGCKTRYSEAMMSAIRDCGFPTLEVDATNSNNNYSGGELKKFTMERHAGDLRDAFLWASKREAAWLRNKFALAGHSMGGYSVLEMAAQMAEDVKFVVAFSPVISGKQVKAAWDPQHLKTWKRDGFFEVKGDFLQDGTLPWSVWQEWEKHDVRTVADKLTMPILFVVGADDVVIPARDVEEFADSLPNGHPNNRVAVIQGADHLFQSPDGVIQNGELFQQVGKFIDTLDR